MTTAHHRIVSFYIGDDWVMTGTLFGNGSDNLDLTNAVIDWEMKDLNDAVILDKTKATITVVDPVLGKIMITVDEATSASVVAGAYRDVLRVTDASGFTDTLWVGSIVVKSGIV